jgi:hypothetical protein
VDGVNPVLYYTGVGSRETPVFVMRAMTFIARFLSQEGFILRSGGADGADDAFEKGANPELADIYLPWKNFNKRNSPLYEVGDDAIALAMTIHPTPTKLRDSVKRLHGRNCYQVLGDDLATPSEFLICWTTDAVRTGGTRTAIVLAERNNIPVLNLGKCETYEECIDAFETFYMMFG